MTAGWIGASGSDAPHRDARVSRRTVVTAAVVILVVAVAIAVPVLLASADRPSEPAAPAVVAPAAPAVVLPTAAATAPALVLPSVFTPSRPKSVPPHGGPVLRCPGLVRGLCAH